MQFHDRVAAGQSLAAKLTIYQQRQDVLVLALPRGGVPVAYEISTALGVPLDVFLVRKLGVPGQEELAMGAIAMPDICVFNDDIINLTHISETEINRVIAQEQIELQRRNQLYRQSRPAPDLKNHTVILVDDGVATGATMRAAVTAIKTLQPDRIVIAVPVSARQTYLEFKALVDEVVCLITPEPLYAIGMWYEDFSQTTDEEVCTLLQQGEKS